MEIKVQLTPVVDQMLAALAASTSMSANEVISSLITARYLSLKSEEGYSSIPEALDSIVDDRSALMIRLAES